MKKQSGFTLIELVIVIVILGILAATAVPKFVNLQGDARAAALKGVKGALEGAASLAYAKAAIDGHEKDDGTGNFTANGVALVYGYPAATSAALSTATELSAEEWTISVSGSDAVIVAKGAISGADGTDTSLQCRVLYKAATSDARPTITAQVPGC